MLAEVVPGHKSCKTIQVRDAAQVERPGVIRDSCPAEFARSSFPSMPLGGMFIPRMLKIGIDTGGTFTDFIVLGHGRIRTL